MRMWTAFLVPAVLFTAAIRPCGAQEKTGVGLELEFVTEAAVQTAAETASVDDERLVGELRAAEGAHAWGPVSDFNRRFQMARTGEAPIIDGRLDDRCWEKAAVLEDFLVSRSFNDKGLARYAADRTEARVLFDDAGIYVAARALQDPGTIYTTIKDNGLLRPDLDWEHAAEQWANTGCDEIEVVIDPELTTASYYSFHVNPDGVTQKMYMPCARVYDGQYKRIDPVVVADETWQAAASRDEKGWYVEMFIPYRSIGLQPIAPAEEGTVFFDMVENRTVMGFNVNRVSHARREPSSWSPSRGAMFFRDAHHFGHAYFRPLAAQFEEVDCGDFFAGDTTVNVAVRAKGAESTPLTVKFKITGEDYSYEAKKEILAVPGTPEKVAFAFEPAPPGRYRLEMRLTTVEGYLLDRARYVFEAPEPVVAVPLKTVLYEGERDFPVSLTVNMPPGAADELRFRIISGGRTLVEETAGALPAGETLLPFEVKGLAAGEYEFEAQALRAGAVAAAAREAFSVIEDPYALELSGTAGEGTPEAPGVPEGFQALAAGDAGRDEARKFEGEIAYLDDAATEKGYLWYAVTATDDFYTGGGLRDGGGIARPPRKAQLAEPVRAFAAGGEYEAVAFAVFALKDIEAPAVEFSELRSAGGVIPTIRMDLRAERPDRFLVGREVLGAMPAYTARRYLLTIHVPRGTPAGLYRGTLGLTVGDGPKEERPYQLLVLPFALEASPTLASIYGRIYGNELDIVQAWDLLAHGFDNYTCINVFARDQTTGGSVQHIIWGVRKPTGEGWIGDDPQKFPMLLNEQVYENIKKTGLRGPIVVDVNRFLRYAPCTGENAELFEKLVRKIEAMRQDYDLPEFVYHLVDEPNNHFTYDDGRYGRRYGILRVEFYGEVLRKLGLRQYVTINSTQRGYDIGEKVRDDVDIWVPNYISDENYVSRWLARGREVWLYNYAGDGACKGAMRSTYGFYALSMGATGVTIWNHRSFVRRTRGESKFLDSTPWEAAREGIDDARYAATLAATIDAALLEGDEKAILAEEAAFEIEEILAAWPVATSEKVLFERKHDASEWNKWRWIIARWILTLQDHI